MMTFKSQICTTREQSERLLALGLKPETADMYWWNGRSWVYDSPFCADDEIPAWSLHRLIEMMPISLPCEKMQSLEGLFSITRRQGNTFTIGYVWSMESCGDLYDAMVYAIEWLIKEGYFNKEYLVNQTEIEEHCKGVLEYLDYIRGEEE